MLVTQLLRSWRVVVAALVIASCPSGDARGADAPSCGELPCRANGVPYVTADGKITVFAGEKFWVELKLEGDKVVGLVPRQGKEVPGAILLNLFVERGATALVWGNQLDRPIRFEATMIAPRREALPTLKCPFSPKKYTYNVWNFVVEAVEIGNFSFTPADGADCD
jgi:hypothetical protein